MADTSKKIGFLVANEGIEQTELTEPWDAVEQAGYTPVLIAPKMEEVQAFNHLTAGDTFDPDMTSSEIGVDDFAAIVLPGGVANPDQLRLDTDAVRFVADFVATGEPVAVICHGPWTLVEAGVLGGRRLTSWPSLRTDIENAGGTWTDQEVVEDGNLITSRKPDDLPAFNKALLDQLNRAPTRSA